MRIKKKISIYYTICDSKSNARRLGTKMVSKNLAVCVNIIDNIQSIYKDDSKIKRTNELILIIKTKSDKKQLYKFIKKNHSYKIPFISKILIKNVNKEYLNWAYLN